MQVDGSSKHEQELSSGVGCTALDVDGLTCGHNPRVVGTHRVVGAGEGGRGLARWRYVCQTDREVCETDHWKEARNCQRNPAVVEEEEKAEAVVDAEGRGKMKGRRQWRRRRRRKRSRRRRRWSRKRELLLFCHHYCLCYNQCYNTVRMARITTITKHSVYRRVIC